MQSEKSTKKERYQNLEQKWRKGIATLDTHGMCFGGTTTINECLLTVKPITLA